MRSQQFGLLILALLASSFGTSASAQSTSTDRMIPSRQVLARHGLELAWWGQALMNPSRDKVEHLCCDEDCVYVQSTNGVVSAFDMMSGHRRWAVQIGQFDPPSFRITTNEDVGLVIIGSKMYGLNKLSGKILWDLRLPGQASTSPAADAERVFVGMLDGSMFAFNLKKIRKLYQEGRLPEWSYQTIAWRYKTSREISSPPLIFGTRVAMASRDGNVYAVSVERPKLIFQFETDAPIVAPIARVDDLLYIASEDFSFYTLRVKPRLEEKNDKSAGEGVFVEESYKRDKESGKVVWEFTSGRPIRKAPVPIGHDIFLMPDRGGFFSLDSHTGVQKWWQPQGVDYVAATAKRVYCVDRDNNLLVLNREDGNISSTLSLHRFNVRFGNDRTDRIVVSTESGLVMVLREQGRLLPTFHMYPDRLPLLPEFAPEDGEAPAEEMMPGEGDMPGEAEMEKESETKEEN